jgi:hypothetical protein
VLIAIPLFSKSKIILVCFETVIIALSRLSQSELEIVFGDNAKILANSGCP